MLHLAWQMSGDVVGVQTSMKSFDAVGSKIRKYQKSLASYTTKSHLLPFSPAILRRYMRGMFFLSSYSASMRISCSPNHLVLWKT